VPYPKLLGESLAIKKQENCVIAIVNTKGWKTFFIFGFRLEPKM